MASGSFDSTATVLPSLASNQQTIMTQRSARQSHLFRLRMQRWWVCAEWRSAAT